MAKRIKKPVVVYTPPPAPSPCPGIFVPGLPKAGVKA